MIKSIITSAVTALVVATLFFVSTPRAQAPVVDNSSSLGSNIETTKVLFGDGWKSGGAIRIGQTVGQFGTPLTKLIATSSCGLILAGVSQAASTSKSYDCLIVGARTGDMVLTNFGTSTGPVGMGWAVVGADASTTANYVTLKVANLTGAAAVAPPEVASSTKVLILRLSSKASDYYQP